jgi:preprotein translocase subunit YajC
MVIRPQRRRQLQQLEMQNELHVDDEIITAGGVHAYIRQLDDEVLTVEIAPEVLVRLDRRAVAGVVRPDEPENQPEPVNQAGPFES